MQRLTITLLGGFETRIAGAERRLSLPKKTQALLGYLALAQRPVTRVELAALLWGETGRQQAQQSLRQTLSGLRQALAGETPVVDADGQSVELQYDRVMVDALAFQELIGKGDRQSLADAIALYRGELLAGLDLDEAPFEEWLLAQRERLRELAMNGLSRLLAQESNAGAL